MTRTRIAGYVSLGATALAAAVAYLLPAHVERRLNRVAAPPPYRVGEADRALCDSLGFVTNLHSDALPWWRDLDERVGRGHVDVPRLVGAGVALHALTIVTKTPQGQNYRADDASANDVTAPVLAPRAEGFAPAEIEAVPGGNVRDFLPANLPAR